MNTVQQEGSYFWSGGLTAVEQHTCIYLTHFPSLIFHPSSFSSNKPIQTKTLMTARLSPHHRIFYWLMVRILEKRQVIMWCLRTAPPLDHHFLPWPRKLRETLSSQSQWAYWYHHIQKARWFWRLLCCSLGFHSFHFMPNCNRPSICILIFYVW